MIVAAQHSDSIVLLYIKSLLSQADIQQLVADLQVLSVGWQAYAWQCSHELAVQG